MLYIGCFLVNLPPRFAISTQHFALFEELLELVIEVFDPEGMPVNVSLANGSPIEAEMRDNVLIWNVTMQKRTSFFEQRISVKPLPPLISQCPWLNARVEMEVAFHIQISPGGLAFMHVIVFLASLETSVRQTSTIVAPTPAYEVMAFISFCSSFR